MIRVKHCFKNGNDQRHVKNVKINRSRQLTPDGVVGTDMYFTSSDAG